MSVPLSLDRDSVKEPVNKLALCIVKDAVKLSADAISLELDLDLHSMVERERKVIWEKYRRPSFYEAIFNNKFKAYFCYKSSSVDKLLFELGRLPEAVKLTYIINGVEQAMPPISGILYEDIIGILLAAAGVPPKTSGDVAAVMETTKPVSKWRLESNDLTRRFQLKRIRKD